MNINVPDISHSSYKILYELDSLPESTLESTIDKLEENDKNWTINLLSKSIFSSISTDNSIINRERMQHAFSMLSKLKHRIPDEQAEKLVNYVQTYSETVNLFNRLSRLTLKELIKEVAKLEEEKPGYYAYCVELSECMNINHSQVNKIQDTLNSQLKAITQSEFEQIIKQVSQKEHPVNFYAVLLKNGYSTELTNINFDVKNLTTIRQVGIGDTPHWGKDVLKNVDFRGISFNKCHMNWVDFSTSRFSECQFRECNFRHSVFMSAKFNQCEFVKCTFEDAIFDNSEINQTKLIDSSLKFCSLIGSKINKVELNKCALKGACFLNATVTSSTISNSSLRNCLLYESKNHFAFDQCTDVEVTLPVVALLWNHHSPGVSADKVNESLKRSQSIPVKFNYLPENINTNKLGDEIDSILLGVTPLIQSNVLEGGIPQELIKQGKHRESSSTNVQMQLICKEAEQIADSIDAILLPGGADIHPQFYGKNKDPKTVTDPDYRRSIMEFALLDQATERGIPIMGICRGSQLGNIFFGGTLNQHVEGHDTSQGVKNAVQTLSTTKASTSGKGLIRHVVEKPTRYMGLSVHHQAMDVIPEQFEIVVKGKGIPKALEGKIGAPKLMLQFHPEFSGDRSDLKAKMVSALLSDENKDFWNILSDAGKTYHQKKMMHQELEKAEISPFPSVKLKKTEKKIKSNESPVSDRQILRQRINLGLDINKNYALGGQSPLLLTDTTTSAELFPIGFTVLKSQDKESKLVGLMTEALTVHLDKSTNPLGIETPLTKGFLVDLTADLGESIKTDGDKDQEELFQEQLKSSTEKLNHIIEVSLKELEKTIPELKERLQHLREFIKNNSTCVCRVEMNDMGSVGGIKVLPVFHSLKGEEILKKHKPFLDFIDLADLHISVSNVRKYLMEDQASFSRREALFFPYKSDFTHLDVIKQLKEKLDSQKLKEASPHTRILGKATLQILEGLFKEITEEQWEALNSNPEKRESLQKALCRIQSGLIVADFSINDFKKFPQTIELIKLEIANLLELTTPFKYEDFERIYKQKLKLIPGDLLLFLKANLDKTAINVSTGVDRAILKDNPNSSKVHVKGCGELTLGKKLVFDKAMADSSVKKVDLYVGRLNPKIVTDTDHIHYTQRDIIADIKRIINEKPDTKHLTITIDSTTDYINSTGNFEILNKFQKEIKEGKLNFVILREGQKFDMFGMDDYNGSPCYVINNGAPQWDSFNTMLKDKAHQADPLSLQWFCLCTQYASDLQDEYRRSIFENTREVIKHVPKSLKARKGKSERIRVSTMDNKIEPAFIDIKVTGMGHGIQARSIMKKFYQKCHEHGINVSPHESLVSYHPSIDPLIRSDCSSLRVKPGMNARENVVINEFLKELA